MSFAEFMDTLHRWKADAASINEVRAQLSRLLDDAAAEELEEVAGGILTMSRPTDEWVHDFLRTRAAELRR